MVDAFTFDNGAPKRFASRSAMYDYMIENEHIIIEGEDAPKFRAHAEKRANDVKNKNKDKASEALARIEVA